MNHRQNFILLSLVTLTTFSTRAFALEEKDLNPDSMKIIDKCTVVKAVSSQPAPVVAVANPAPAQSGAPVTATSASTSQPAPAAPIASDDVHTLWIFKQWALPSNIDTKKTKRVALPQMQNQSELYKQLDSLIAQEKVKTLFAENCQNEIDSSFKTSFNGWSFNALKEMSTKSEYPLVLTHLALKLEAKYSTKLRTFCTDEIKLNQDVQFALSDARGVAGYHQRLTQYKGSSERLKPYLDGVIELYHLPKDTNVDQAISKLQTEMKLVKEKLQTAMALRHEKMLAPVFSKNPKEAVLVVDGSSIKGMVSVLEKNKWNCFIVEPAGYHGENEKLIQSLDQILLPTSSKTSTREEIPTYLEKVGETLKSIRARSRSVASQDEAYAPLSREHTLQNSVTGATILPASTTE